MLPILGLFRIRRLLRSARLYGRTNLIEQFLELRIANAPRRRVEAGQHAPRDPAVGGILRGFRLIEQLRDALLEFGETGYVRHAIAELIDLGGDMPVPRLLAPVGF